MRGARQRMRLGFFLREALRALKRNAVPSLRRDGHRARHGARARRLHPGRAGHDRRGQRGPRQGDRRRLPQDGRHADATSTRVERPARDRAADVEQRRVRLQGAGLREREASATRRPTSCSAPTRCRTRSASRPTSPDDIGKIRDALAPRRRRRRRTVDRPRDRRGPQPRGGHEQDPLRHARREAHDGAARAACWCSPRCC